MYDYTRPQLLSWLFLLCFSAVDTYFEVFVIYVTGEGGGGGGRLWAPTTFSDKGCMYVMMIALFCRQAT